MATLLELQTAILDISKNHYIQTESDVVLSSRINNAVNDIAGGIRMPNGEISPPLPDLYKSAIVATSLTLPYVALPIDYMRNLFCVIDNSGNKIEPPRGGNYYSFMLFLKSIGSLDLSEKGSVYRACVKGSKLYYQGIPSVSVNLTVLYYRKPVAMSLETETPDGIPEHLQIRLIKHYVGHQLAREMVDGTDKMAAYHESEFYKAMIDLTDFIGITEAAPEYYGSDGLEDAGACDG